VSSKIDRPTRPGPGVLEITRYLAGLQHERCRARVPGCDGVDQSDHPLVARAERGVAGSDVTGELHHRKVMRAFAVVLNDERNRPAGRHARARFQHVALEDDLELRNLDHQAPVRDGSASSFSTTYSPNAATSYPLCNWKIAAMRRRS